MGQAIRKKNTSQATKALYVVAAGVVLYFSLSKKTIKTVRSYIEKYLKNYKSKLFVFSLLLVLFLFSNPVVRLALLLLMTFIAVDSVLSFGDGVGVGGKDSKATKDKDKQADDGKPGFTPIAPGTPTGLATPLFCSDSAFVYISSSIQQKGKWINGYPKSNNDKKWVPTFALLDGSGRPGPSSVDQFMDRLAHLITKEKKKIVVVVDRKLGEILGLRQTEKLAKILSADLKSNLKEKIGKTSNLSYKRTPGISCPGVKITDPTLRSDSWYGIKRKLILEYRK